MPPFAHGRKPDRPGALSRRNAIGGALALGLLGAAPPAAPPLPVTEVAPGVFVFRGAHEEATAANLGGIANLGFVVGNDAAAVIDTGGSAAEGRRLRASLFHRTALPVRWVVNTHFHPDHALGNAAFAGPGTTIVGHANLPRGLAARADTYLDGLRRALGDAATGTGIVPPTLLVRDRLSLDLGGRTLELKAWPAAHTDADLTVLDSATGTLFAGDLVFLERVPAIDGSLRGWVDAIAGLRREAGIRRVVPGHGPASAPWPDALDDEERYLRLILDETRAALAAGRSLDQAVATVGRSERGRWLLFDDYNDRNVATAYTELEWE
ncbi:quinoprotein relay system zinc metallohydrolase 2 [Inquilinus sp. Marseille-Q2685]|uniref:quinoprotein relay system zinc metallohydrolase 2 n=1 Tax=Inquilinus sp. Marseille-Q2685 TaxID=2866581 RepID=UPI001CE436B1|nr:quinoprotein relay system zinc metallohydrolase 2 [Inquilinus sp. Marseille-Q2685]